VMGRPAPRTVGHAAVASTDRAEEGTLHMPFVDGGPTKDTEELRDLEPHVAVIVRDGTMYEDTPK
jgi:hypothetical protein